MASVVYDFNIVSTDELWEYLQSINEYQDKIVAVTQHENHYTIFYERSGNKKDGE